MIYIKPEIEIFFLNTEQDLLLKFSQVDNDGDGKTDQRPIIDGNPEDGDIGAQRGWFDNDDFGPWED